MTKSQERLVKIWIYIVGVFCAFINIIGYLAYTISLSHHTGNMVYVLNYSFQSYPFDLIFLLFLLMILFIIGGIVSSFINKNRDFHMEHKYGEIQLFIGVFILILYFLPIPMEVFVLFLSFSLGIENGLIRSFKEFGFKTTHITGTLSDLGSMIGYYLQKNKDVSWKISFELFLLLSFVVGTVLGLWVYNYIEQRAFIVSGCGFIIIGLVFIYLRRLFDKNVTNY